jgi:hypothetical protein
MYSFMMAKVAASTANRETKSLEQLSNECVATAGGNTDTEVFLHDAAQILNRITHMYTTTTYPTIGSTNAATASDDLITGVTATSRASHQNNRATNNSSPSAQASPTMLLQEFNNIVRAYASAHLRSKLTAVMYRIRAYGYGKEKKWQSALKCLLKIRPVGVNKQDVSFTLNDLDVDTLLMMVEVYEALEM